MISEDYREQNKMLHDDNPDYGIKGAKRAAHVQRLIEYRQFLTQSTERVSVLDYGCGKRMLSTEVKPKVNGGVDWTDFDPCIKGFDTPPEPADIVVCTDVLEHIEPDCLDEVLDDLQRLARYLLYATIATREAKKSLPDGRNTHLIVQPMEWWMPRLSKRWGEWATNVERLPGATGFLFSATKVK